MTAQPAHRRTAAATLRHTGTTVVASLPITVESVCVLTAISRWTWVSRFQNVYILDFIGAKGDGHGGNNWSYKSCKAPVKSSASTNQHPAIYRPDVLPVTQPTVYVTALKGKTKSLLNVVEKSLPDLVKVVQQQFVGEVGTFMFLACQVVSRRLDYCNAVLAGLPAIQLSRLQSILHDAARLIYSARRCDHVTSLLAAPLAVCFCSRTRAVLSTTVSNYVVCTSRCCIPKISKSVVFFTELFKNKQKGRL